MRKFLGTASIIFIGMFFLVSGDTYQPKILSDTELSQIKGGETCVWCEGPCTVIINPWTGGSYTVCEGECIFYNCYEDESP